MEKKDYDQYIVKMDGSGRVTLRNRKFLRKYKPYYRREDQLFNAPIPAAAWQQPLATPAHRRHLCDRRHPCDLRHLCDRRHLCNLRHLQRYLRHLQRDLRHLQCDLRHLCDPRYLCDLRHPRVMPSNLSPRHHQDRQRDLDDRLSRQLG